MPLIAEPVALDPHLIDGLTDFRICNDLFEPLTTLDATGGVIPGAAASWTESADHLTWTFALRPDERWSDDTTPFMQQPGRSPRKPGPRARRG